MLIYLLEKHHNAGKTNLFQYSRCKSITVPGEHPQRDVQAPARASLILCVILIALLDKGHWQMLGAISREKPAELQNSESR
jgi:hypothetical protein